MAAIVNVVSSAPTIAEFEGVEASIPLDVQREYRMMDVMARISSGWTRAGVEYCFEGQDLLQVEPWEYFLQYTEGQGNVWRGMIEAWEGVVESLPRLLSAGVEPCWWCALPTPGEARAGALPACACDNDEYCGHAHHMVKTMWWEATGLPIQQCPARGVQQLQGLSVREWQAICDGLPLGEDYAERHSALNLHCLFGGLPRIRQYMKAWSITAHDAGGFRLPRAGGKWNRKGWADLALKFGPEVLSRLHLAPRLEEANGGRVPHSLNAIRALLTRMPGGVLALLGLDEEDEEDYKYVLAHAVPGPLQPRVLAKEGRYTLRVLEHTDLLGPALGLVTDCCQHLHGVGRDCAVHGVTSPNGGFVVVEDEGAIIAQSWYWVDGRGGLCFDNVECKGGFVSRQETLVALYSQATAWLLENGYHKVTMGTGYLEIETPWKKANRPLVPCDYDGYRDSRNQLLLGKKS
jgi:hypothetical protein